MKSHTIDDRRLISVIFSELMFLGGLVMAKNLDTSSSIGEVQIDLTDQINAKIVIPWISTEKKQIVLEFLLNGKYFTCECLADDKQGVWKLPDKLTIEDRRNNIRHSFKKELGCEIIIRDQTIIGNPITLTSKHIACSIPKNYTELLKKQKLKLIIYGSKSSSPVTLSACELISSRTLDASNDIVILVVNGVINEHQKRKAERFPANEINDSPSIKLESQDITPNHSIIGEVESISLTGFTIKTDTTPLLGVPYHSIEIGVQVYFIRKTSTGSYAFAIEQGLQGDIKSWKKFIERYTPLLSTTTPDVKILSQFLIECGFVKGERRTKFGTNANLHPVDEWIDPELFKRYLEYNSNCNIGGQISAVRFSTAGWLIQEVATGIHKREGILPLMKKALKQLYSDSCSHFTNTSQFGVIYDPKIRPIDNIWNNVLTRNHKRYLCMHFVAPPNIQNDGAQFTELDSSKLKTLVTVFSMELVKFFGLTELALGTSEVNRKLKITSPQYGIQTQLIKHKENTVLLYRFSGPYTLNVSGLVNSVFVLPFENLDHHSLINILALAKTLPISEGTSDYLLVTSDLDNDLKKDSNKIFNLIIEDLKECGIKLLEHDNAA